MSLAVRSGFSRVPERRELASSRDRLCQTGDFGVEAGEFPPGTLRPDLEKFDVGTDQIERLRQRLLQDVDAEKVALDRREHGLVGFHEEHLEVVRTDEPASSVVRHATVRRCTTTPGVVGVDEHTATADATLAEARQ
jgi:hypothetical protein